MRLLLVVAVVALGGAIVVAGMGVLGKVIAGIGTAFSGAITQVTATPSPSPTEALAPNAPMLTQPPQPYTNQATIDLSGTIPATYVGQEGVTIRIYRTLENAGPEQVAQIPAGETPGFVVPGIELAKGRNDFSATLVGPGGESETSIIATYILDTSKPKITIAQPANDAVVNDGTVTIQGKTQAHAALVARNEANSASITGTAGDDGSFELILAIGPGPNGIRVTATDPAGNQGETVLNVLRGSGKLSARITASRYQFTGRSLPAVITLTVRVTDPDGRPLDGASVTFTLTLPNVGPITQLLMTDGTGVASWQTTIPLGATDGRGIAAALVETDAFGTTTTQTVITIVK